MAEGTNEETTRAAQIRAHQGYHETEVSCTGEAGLHNSFILCNKNLHHRDFIPVGDFDLKHLPSGYQDKDLLDAVKAKSALTCRLSTSCISDGRPDTYPDDNTRPYPFAADKGKSCLRTGTGWVFDIQYVDWEKIPCPCTECKTSAADTQTPKKEWAFVYMRTARHVVFDEEEARHTVFRFFYDCQEMDVKTAPAIMGLSVLTSENKYDVCEVFCVTHDMDLVKHLDEMRSRWSDLYNKLVKKYSANKDTDRNGPCERDDADSRPNLCIIVSHPHGCNKQITVGEWTDRHVVQTPFKGPYKGLEFCWYQYNTPTCPGSSGAPVIKLVKGKFALDASYQHPHSEGRPGNINSCGIDREFFMQ